MTRKLIPLFLLMLSIPGYAENPRTMRIDYYHSGNFEAELFSLHRVVLEPLPFPGNLAQPIDKTLRGKYAFEIVDAESGDTAWSRSFSSIYGEWETTGEARRLNRTFHESLRFAGQAKPFDAILLKRDSQNQFQEIWRLRVDPDDYLVHQESAAFTDRVIQIENNGDPEQKVDLLILGDGFTAEEHDKFVSSAKALSEALFAVSPFKERRDDFNVWALAPAASESGVSRPSTGVYRDSPFRATYDAFRSERYVLTEDNIGMRQAASSAPYDFIEILTNSDTYGGGGIYGLYSTAAAMSDWADYLFIHEFGHHFAGLADEYYTSSVAYEPPSEIVEPYEPNVTALKDPAKLKWRHLVKSETSLPTPWPKTEYEEHAIAYQARRARMREEDVSEAEMNKLFREVQVFSEGLFSKAGQRDTIGAFEGANYQAKGFYRSEMNCLMFTRTPRFCQVCSDAIVRVIDEYSQAGQ